MHACRFVVWRLGVHDCSRRYRDGLQGVGADDTSLQVCPVIRRELYCTGGLCPIRGGGGEDEVCSRDVLCAVGTCL